MIGTTLTAEETTARLASLAGYLEPLRPVWEHRTFRQVPCPWERDFPALSTWLRALSNDAIDALESDPSLARREAPAPYGEWDVRATELSEVSAFPPGSWRTHSDAALGYGIPARKWQQIREFTKAALPHLGPSAARVLDWCAGKGHLGRTLAWLSARPLVAVERNPTLCAEGAALAERLGVQSHFEVRDALDPDTANVLGADMAALSLHACGSLTDTLLRSACVHGLPTTVSAPCCYHAQTERRARYRPLSAAGRAHDLLLEPHLLRLPTSDEVVARPALRVARRRELAWRLGLDLLLREASGVDLYTQVGSVSSAMLDLPFAAFCERLATRDELSLPPRYDAAKAEAAGWERARLCRALGVVRCIFRRPVELWLVLDKACFLAENGREVALGTFCARAVTPRNLMLVSHLGRG